MRKILLVDDEAKIRQIYQKVLEFEGYEVVQAADCAEATRFLVEDRRIDVVLLDINMPVSDGGVLFRMIRMMDPEIRVIVTSAYPLQDQKSRIEKADDYYDKSHGTRVLVEKIKGTLSKN